MYETLKAHNRLPKRLSSLSILRKEGFIPGVIFGKGIESINLKINAKELKKFLGHAKHVFNLDIDGTTHLVGLDTIQNDAVGKKLLHIAFHKIIAGQVTTMTIPLLLVGDAPGKKEGGTIQQVIHEITLKGLPKDIPEYIQLDLSRLELNHSLHFSDLPQIKGLEYKISDNEATLATCHHVKVKVEAEPEAVSPQDTPLVEETTAESKAQDKSKDEEAA